MRTTHSSRRRRALIAVAALAVFTAILAVLGGASGSKAASSNPVNVRPEISGPQKLAPGAATFSCQGKPINGSQGIVCYSPSQIQRAYGYSSLLAQGINGTGRTIVIIDAFSNPYLAGPGGDLAIQDAAFGLPAPPAFNILAPFGTNSTITNDNEAGWAEEETLDVLWAHAMAPGATIDLVEAPSNSDQDLYDVTKWAVDNNLGDVISQSFGEAEQCMNSTIASEQHTLFAEAVAKGMTVFASSGDSGASQGDCNTGATPILAASTPASDPNVTGVGGTTLSADLAGNYLGEKAWTEGLFGITCNPPDDDDINCSGGGFSTVFSRPLWQPQSQQSPGDHNERGVPDVSYNAAVNGGVLTHCTICNILAGVPPSQWTATFFLFGGTSSGSPQWSALTADADQLGHHRLGLINPSLYAAAHIAGALHDVTTGNNKVNDLGNEGYKATAGWDPVTGLGTPNAAVLLPALVELSSLH